MANALGSSSIARALRDAVKDSDNPLRGMLLQQYA